MNRSFLITVDTEGDNQWDLYHGEKITTENAKYIPKFQAVCCEHNLKPVYLIDYEMVCDDSLVSFLKEQLSDGLCEIGMHLHAWNSPPFKYIEERYRGNPYITEYPRETIYAKMAYLTELIEKRIGVRPTSHRSGRWATNAALFDILTELGYNVDCSIVAGCNMSRLPGRSTAFGFDYTNALDTAYMINESILEVPMSVNHKRTIHGFSIRNRIKNVLLGKDIWLRPAMATVEEMKAHIDEKIRRKADYVEFMIHSSELMPLANPYFRTELEVDQAYRDMCSVFEYARQNGFAGRTLREYRSEIWEAKESGET